ncbi:MAG: lysylphosphatidylglycerol synthase transmembrane domain-containing protein [bacterium]|nr:lysylphosphatidylglycerol synthase transmembrane domain-containing protein [bacterium]
MKRQQRLLVIVGLAISVFFLVIAFNGLSPALVVDYMRTADPLPLVGGAAWYFTAVAVISLRWGFLLRSSKAVRFGMLFRLVCIGYMGNNVYPLRSGELLRIFLLQVRAGVPMVRATTVVIIERIFDGLVMLTFIVVALALTGIASPAITAIVTFAAPLFIAALLIFFALAARPQALAALITTVTKVLPVALRDKVNALGQDVIDGLACFRSPADLFGAVIASYVSWMLEASVYAIVSWAFGLNISYGLALLVVGVVNLAGLIPASPGQFGVYEFFVRTVLIAAGIGQGIATAYAFTIHLVIWLPVTLLGFFFLIRQGMGGVGVVAQARQRTTPLEQQTTPLEQRTTPLEQRTTPR